jgi:hypothetical protein
MKPEFSAGFGGSVFLQNVGNHVPEQKHYMVLAISSPCYGGRTFPVLSNLQFGLCFLLVLVYKCGVGIVVGYGLYGHASFPGRGKSFILLRSVDRLRVSPSLLPNGNQGLFVWEQNRMGVKLTTQ